jgi:hypothetical protein
MSLDHGASPEFLDLVRRPAAELRELVRNGHAPDLADLSGREFRGANTPRSTRLLGIRRFVKGFRADPSGATGYNVRVTGADLTTPWTTTLWRGHREYAPFRVMVVGPGAPDHRYDDALFLDYGAEGSGPSPERTLRDYVVRVAPESPLLLGHAWLALGRRRLPLAFFVLEPLE